MVHDADHPEIPEVKITAEQREQLLADLLKACSGDKTAVQVDDESLQEVAKDMSRHDAQVPIIAVFPNSIEEVAGCVKACRKVRVPMVPRGGGTGVEGGAVPSRGSVVISTERLRKLELRKSELMAVVGAGIHKDELRKFLAPHNLLFGPDPSSNPSVGGMAATGGSGMTTLRYGTTKENVVSLIVVTAKGDILQTRKEVRKSSSGYELNQLFMGSEGTLGIICELTVRLKKIPSHRSGGLFPFNDVKSAVQTVVDAVQADPPSLLRCELLNQEGVECTNAMFNTELPVKPTLFIELVGEEDSALRKDFDTLTKLAVGHGCPQGEVQFAEKGDQLDEVWEARRGCYLAAMRVRKQKGGDRVFISDVCVPIPLLAEAVDESERICHALGMKCIICAHIADGNFHCLVPHQLHELPKVKEFEKKIIDHTLKIGGTVTGEHGVGTGKVMHSCREHGPIHVAMQQSIKKALDPEWLMNPGKVLPIPSASEMAKL
mmetsp:Transcript_62783/g.132592  ORF Transcript_62783/g.132592 Transcript_62783/m.132592 type:complete len:490 (-) Transcript_62783:107-1576(-)